jgi:hypothetical protein
MGFGRVSKKPESSHRKDSRQKHRVRSWLYVKEPDSFLTKLLAMASLYFENVAQPPSSILSPACKIRAALPILLISKSVQSCESP